jgi:hypothetical protein
VRQINPYKTRSLIYNFFNFSRVPVVTEEILPKNIPEEAKAAN